MFEFPTCHQTLLGFGCQLDTFERSKLSISEIMKSLLIYGFEVYEDKRGMSSDIGCESTAH